MSNSPFATSGPLCCVHHTLLSLQIEGAKTAEGRSPLQLYIANVDSKSGAIDYAQILGFGEGKRLLQKDEEFEQTLKESEDCASAVGRKLTGLPEGIKKVPKHRIFCADESPNYHTWFANRGGLITESIFTSLNTGQTPAQVDVDLPSIMRSNSGSEGGQVRPDPYHLTGTLYSDIFVMPLQNIEGSSSSSAPSSYNTPLMLS